MFKCAKITKVDLADYYYFVLWLIHGALFTFRHLLHHQLVWRTLHRQVTCILIGWNNYSYSYAMWSFNGYSYVRPCFIGQLHLYAMPCFIGYNDVMHSFMDYSSITQHSYWLLSQQNKCNISFMQNNNANPT